MILTGIFLFGGAAIVLRQTASTNDRGLILDGLAFSVTEATYIYWLLCAASVCFVLAFIGLAIARRHGPQWIRLTDRSIILPPHNWSRTQTEIPYSAITALQIRTVRRLRFLTLVHQTGKSVILSSKLRSAGEFDRLTGLIAENVRRCAPQAGRIDGPDSAGDVRRQA
jgi:hypothetical protein